MIETLFEFDERNYRECQKAFRGDNNQEYYLGDYIIHGGASIDVRADKKPVGACSIIRLRSSSNLLFRRAWQHIREDATDVTVLWFVKHGRIALSHQTGQTVAQPGDFIVTNSMSPFTMECLIDEDARHEVFHVVVPTLVFRRYIADEVQSGFSVAAERSEFTIAEQILWDIFEHDNALSDHIEQRLLDTALTVLADALQDCEGLTQPRLSLAERRLQDVLRFIEIHLSDSKLNAAMVAQACGISQRYLSHLLRQHGTSFSTLVWDWRLKAAHQWLSTSNPKDISIAEIAFGVGFKSPAHFSRLFKRVYDVSPREYRARQPAESLPARARGTEFFVSSSQSIQ